VVGSGIPLFQAAAANFNPFTEIKVDTKTPQRGRCSGFCQGTPLS
jgi:non-heme chloroperoxidase